MSLPTAEELAAIVNANPPAVGEQRFVHADKGEGRIYCSRDAAGKYTATPKPWPQNPWPQKLFDLATELQNLLNT